MDDYQLALAHYGIMFPDVASLGAGTPPVDWKAEYDRLVDSGLGAVLITSTGAEGASASGQRNFDQKVLLNALHARRMALDATYKPFDAAVPDLRPARNLGIIVRLGP